MFRLKKMKAEQIYFNKDFLYIKKKRNIMNFKKVLTLIIIFIEGIIAIDVRLRYSGKRTATWENFAMVGDLLQFDVEASSNETLKKYSGSFYIIYKGRNNTTSVQDLYSFDDCDGSIIKKKFSCLLHDKNMSAEYNITADKMYNEAFLQFKIKHNDKDYYSNLVPFKKIYDIILILNGRLLTKNSNEDYLCNSNNTLELCCYGAPEPCIAIISSDSSQEINRSTECVTYRPDSLEKKNYTFGYKVCGRENRTVFGLEIGYYSPTSDPNGGKIIMKSDNFIGLIIGLILALIAIGAIGTFIIFCCLKKYEKCWFSPPPRQQEEEAVPMNVPNA